MIDVDNNDALETLKRIEELSPPKCKKCPQPRMMVANRSALSMKHFTKKGDLTVISYGLVPHPSGLCYYHLKKELGFFSNCPTSLRYPLSDPSPKILDVCKEV